MWELITSIPIKNCYRCIVNDQEKNLVNRGIFNNKNSRLMDIYEKQIIFTKKINKLLSNHCLD